MFLNWSKALKNLSQSRVPVGPRFACIRRLVAFTATSARPLDWGWYAEDTLCLTPHLSRNSLVPHAVYSGPPSLDSSSGTPNVEKRERKHAIRPREPDQVLPEGVEKNLRPAGQTVPCYKVVMTTELKKIREDLFERCRWGSRGFSRCRRL